LNFLRHHGLQFLAQFGFELNDLFVEGHGLGQVRRTLRLQLLPLLHLLFDAVSQFGFAAKFLAQGQEHLHFHVRENGLSVGEFLVAGVLRRRSPGLLTGS